jgi:hypothetical protein
MSFRRSLITTIALVAVLGTVGPLSASPSSGATTTGAAQPRFECDEVRDGADDDAHRHIRPPRLAGSAVLAISSASTDAATTAAKTTARMISVAQNALGDTETDHRAPGKPSPSSSPPTDSVASPQQSAGRAARSPALTRYAGLISDRTRDSCCALSENLPFNMAMLAASATRAVTRPTSRFSVIPSKTYPMVEARAANSA